MTTGQAILVWLTLGLAGGILYWVRLLTGFYPPDLEECRHILRIAVGFALASVLGPIRLGIELAAKRPDADE